MEHSQDHKVPSTAAKEVLCILCGMPFPSVEDLKLHVAVHQVDKLLQCKVCERYLADIANLSNHLLLHQQTYQSENGEGLSHDNHSQSHGTTHQCKICSSSYAHKCQLKEHMKSHGKKVIPCDICGKLFSNNHVLTRHMRSHTGEKPFLCGVCAKCFAQESDLGRHRLTHTGEKPYECEICQATFVRRCNLKLHTRSLHNGEKPYHCDVCNKSFSRSGDFYRHQLQHSGIRPHACDLCDKRFFRKTNLLHHRKTHENLPSPLLPAGDKKESNLVKSEIDVSILPAELSKRNDEPQNHLNIVECIFPNQ